MSIFTFSTLLLLLLTTTITAIPEPEYSSLLSALRNRNYHVFANAITTTDLSYDILNTHNNFTFFAPIDSVLYTLDMSMSAPDYTTTMRFHVVPNHRLTFSHLKTLPYGSNSFPTLLPAREINIFNPVSLSLPVVAQGVDIVVPDLYYDTHVVVHGLESVMDFRSVNTSSSYENENINASPAVSPLSETKSETVVVQSIESPRSYYKSLTQPLEKHATIGSRSRIIPQAIHHVSLATRSTDAEDETIIGCSVTDDDDDDEGEQMSSANIRRGDRDRNYIRELYNNPTEISCAHE